jgi:hypothetical protein
MEWRIGYSCKHSTMGSAIALMKPWMLLAGGAFLSLTISQATALVEKMASNQCWSEERT